MAEAIAWDPGLADDDLWAELHRHFEIEHRSHGVSRNGRLPSLPADYALPVDEAFAAGRAARNGRFWAASPSGAPWEITGRGKAVSAL